MLNESSAESLELSTLKVVQKDQSFLHYFHVAIGNYLSEKPNICRFIWLLNTGLTVLKWFHSVLCTELVLLKWMLLNNQVSSEH